LKKSTVEGFVIVGAVAVLGAAVVYEMRKHSEAPSNTFTGSTTPINPASAGVVPNASGGYDPGAGTSPFGSTPQAPSASCPAGFTPTYVDGYGWTCKEQQTAALQVQAAASSSANTAQDGYSVSGYHARRDALALQQSLSAQYGGSWSVYLQNGSYSILPSSRVAYLRSIGGDPGALVS